MKHSILCIDDEIDNLDALERLFRKRYTVYKCASGDEGLEVLKKNPNIAVIISDQRMPHMTGVEFLGKSQKLQPEAVRILLTGYTDIESVIASINEGRIYRYVTKPWDPVDFVNAVDKAVERYQLGLELREKNVALEKALNELKVLDQAKSHFMILINHELKTPLTAILSYLDLLTESKLSVEQEKFVSRIQQGADRLLNLVNDVLKLVSAESGLTKVSYKKMGLKKWVAAFSDVVDSKLKEKGQTLAFDVEDISVYADIQILQEVMLRILDNALKFSAKGSSIEVHVTKTAEGARVSVRNPGAPLKQRLIDQITKPFAVDEDIMHHSHGTGLGLSLCQALLRTHHSHLEIENAKGAIVVGFQLKSDPRT